MKVAIFILAVLAVVNANPFADDKDGVWLSPMPKVSPNFRAAPFEELAKLAAIPKRPYPRMGKAVAGCGLSTPLNIDTQIVGGVEATPHEFPWQVALSIKKGVLRYFCGGSLISDEWVLTAAHCTVDSDSIDVIMGAHDRSVNEPTQVTLTSTEIITHADYGSVLLRNDVGLIHLPQPVTLTDAIRPICLPALSDADIGGGVPLTMSGWGITSDGGSQPQLLMKTTMPSITNDECAAVYGITVADATICTSTEATPISGTCSGDSGGPLMETRGSTFYSRGVTSFVSSAGCQSGNPDGFTRTKYYLDWINANTGIAIDP